MLRRPGLGGAVSSSVGHGGAHPGESVRFRHGPSSINPEGGVALARRNPNPARYHEWSAPNGRVYELVDLPHQGMIVKMPTDEDVRNATPCDPCACAIARCASREADGLPALIGARIAYIPAIINDKEVMFRCAVPAATAKGIQHFDLTGEWPRGGFLFAGIPPSNTLDSQHTQQKRYRERWAGKREGSKKHRKVNLRNAANDAKVTITTD